MTIEAYLRSLPETPSAVKEKILRRLWSAGESFPRNWVKSSALLALTGQKYFDRRIRELRDEMGCDIETSTSGSAHVYRLVSTTLSKANPRGYLTARQKADLFARFKSTCVICGKKIAGGSRGLQADHKIPLIRGGKNEPGNWQPLCVDCNVSKRRACEGCTLDCKQCPWAFPDSLKNSLVVPLPTGLYERLERMSASRQKSKVSLVAEAVEEYLTNRTK